MLKKKIWPIFHKFKINPKVKDCWGFLDQKDIYPMERKCMGKGEIVMNESEKNIFKKGVIKGYEEIYNTFYKRGEFLDNLYTTPKLSLALNELNMIREHQAPILDFNSVEVYILNSNVEYGLMKMNDKVLGYWTPAVMKQEIIIGMIGPEFQSIWHQQPIRENKNILYKFQNRIDIWTWQRCLLTKNSPWVVYNINNIII